MSEIPISTEQYIFHGGCYGCTQQNIEGVEFCMGCQYFEANWDLPDLNNEPPSRAELKREELKRAARKKGESKKNGWFGLLPAKGSA